MVKETFEWVHSWCDETNRGDLPRVLLVGDSITHAYQDEVRRLLRGVCYVDYFATAYAIDRPIYNALCEAYMADSRYDLIHFNHGLHGKHMSKEIYKEALRSLLLKAKESKNNPCYVYYCLHKRRKNDR